MIEFSAGPRRSARPAYPFLCVTPCVVCLKKGIYFTYTIVAELAEESEEPRPG